MSLGPRAGAGLRPVTGGLADLVPLLERWLETDDALWVRTSGSTGEPKMVVLSAAALRASVAATHAALGGPGQWWATLPTSSVAGLQTLVRSLLAGHAPVERVDDLTAARRYASLVPTQLHRIVASGDPGPWASLDAVLVGGAAAAPSLVARARELGVPIVRTYGMTETCGGCVYDGFPLDGVGVRTDPDGVIEVAGPMLFDGYRDGSGALQARESTWWPTADLGSMDDTGRLSVLGRRDDVVISGGVNVPLPAVTGALQAMPGVVDALAVGVDDDEWGQRVVALVVAEGSGATPALGALRDAVELAGHPRTWAPREVIVVDAIPLLPSGKPDRLAARTLAQAAGR